MRHLFPSVLIECVFPLAAYAFLNPSKQRAKLAAYVIGILIGDIIVFAVVRGIVVLRERWALKSGRVLNVEGVEMQAGDDEEWEEIRQSSEPANARTEKVA